MAEPNTNPEDFNSPVPHAESSISYSPTKHIQAAERSQKLMLLAVRLLYMVLLVTFSLLPFVGAITEQRDFMIQDYVGAFIATFALGVLVLIIDAATPNKRLASVFGIYLGIVAGLVGALAAGALLDLIAESWELNTSPWLAYLGLVKLAIGITFCYLAVSIVLTTKDDFRLVIPYVEFAKQVRGVRPLAMDSSALIDGRISNFGQTGFLDAPLVAPQFVINELQTLADSSDKLKRARGRRGLDLVASLQADPMIDISIDPSTVPGHSVDHMLIHLAADRQLRILTTDYNLKKVAQIRGVTVLNLNDLANSIRPQVIPGEALEVEIVKHGEGPGQGVGYLPDGTMVVVEDAAARVGQTVALIVTNSLQTSAGRMIFGRVEDGVADEARVVGQMADAATSQPRATARPTRRGDDRSSHNPRR